MITAFYVIFTATLLLASIYFGLQLHIYYKLKDTYNGDFVPFATKFSRAVRFLDKFDKFEEQMKQFEIEFDATEQRINNVLLEIKEYHKKVSSRDAVQKHRDQKGEKLAEVTKELRAHFGEDVIAQGSDIQGTVGKNLSLYQQGNRRKKGRISRR